MLRKAISPINMNYFVGNMRRCTMRCERLYGNIVQKRKDKGTKN